MKPIYKNILYAVLLVVFGLFMGWLIFDGNSHEQITQNETTHNHENETIWTCSMHPQIRQNQPGQCPICGMDLIPLSQAEGSSIAANEVQMSEAAVKLANVQTTPVRNAMPNKDVYLPGKVKVDETSLSEITARFNGRIEKLFINFTGQSVKRGQTLATIYSPQLVTAQKELLEAYKMKENNPSIYQAARNKLKLWSISDRQIDRIVENKEPEYYFSVVSPIAGTITDLLVSVGDYVKEGQSLMKVANLSKVWVVFNAYESDLQWLKEGDNIDFSVKSLPGETFTGKITFIDPIVNTQTRTTAVRVELNNKKGLLKPEMIVNGTVNSNITNGQEALLIPASAVLWTGKKSIVYVKEPSSKSPVFQYREVTLGTSTGSDYVVKEGLKEGEEVVTHGTFKIDAAAQLSGKTSMMNPEEEQTNTRDSIINFEVKQEFKKQLSAVYNAYIPVKNALVNSDGEATQKKAKSLLKNLDQVQMELLEGDAQIQWVNYLKPMKRAMNQMIATNNIAIQRNAFITLSNELFKSLKAFQLQDIKAYYQFCPMANSNNGAFWLSNEDEIRNPYYGEAMLTCGEVVDSVGNF